MMKKMNFEIELYTWLNEEGLVIDLYPADSDNETEFKFTLQELVDKEINSHTFNGKLRNPKTLDKFIKYLDDVADYAKKRVEELS